MPETSKRGKLPFYALVVKFACYHKRSCLLEFPMSRKTLNVDDQLYQYILDNSVRESDTLKSLRQRTGKMSKANMQISPEQGQFMRLLLNLMGATRVIEIGTFTGYSTLCMAQALPQDGRVIACDVSTEWTDIGKSYWEESGVADRIELRIAPALETLADLAEEGLSGKIDFAFIDADKTNYEAYYEHCLELLRPGGLIAIDNTLWSGSVADAADQDEDTVAIRELNKKLHHDERIELSLVPIGDGLTLARKLS